jgi:hypothetical protein
MESYERTRTKQLRLNRVVGEDKEKTTQMKWSRKGYENKTTQTRLKTKKQPDKTED